MSIASNRAFEQKKGAGEYLQRSLLHYAKA